MTWAARTAETRERVLAAWVATPARFREDANAEDDARTGHAGRLVVELAQNAADAAARGGVPGRLLLELTPYCLYAANVGAPLDDAGVESLSHLRVSAKSAGDVGRYGVGFKAVLALTDDPAVVGRGGGVRWSRAETLEVAGAAADASGGLAAELARRAGAVPVMRLPFEAPDDDPDARRLLAEGFDTVVRMPLRDDPARTSAWAVLAELDPLLLLFLPGLESVEVRVEGATRTLRASRDDAAVELDDGGVRSTWRVHTERGQVPAELLADRPVEERERPGYEVTWAVSYAHDGPRAHTGDRRLRAPQPVDERVELPAVLCASFPLDPTRAHVAPGPLAAWLCEQAAGAYVTLLEQLPRTPTLLSLMPAELPAGPVDLALRGHLTELLPRARVLPAAAARERVLRGADACALDLAEASAAVTALLASGVEGMVEPGWGEGPRAAGMRALGVRLLSTADVVDALHGLEAEPRWWGELYSALRLAPDRDALRGLPVPLDDGRLAVGPRDLLLVGEDVPGVRALSRAGVALRRVHPEVAAVPGATELLTSLGAREATASAVLDSPAVRDLVERSSDDDVEIDRAGLVDGVLALLAADPRAGKERPWLSGLALPTSTGAWAPAGELLLGAEHGGRLVGVMASDSPFAVVSDGVVTRHGVDAMTACGVLPSFAVVSDRDVVVDAGGDGHWLDGEDAWLDDVATQVERGEVPAVLPELRAVRDLELVAADPAAWVKALSELATADLRPLVVDPAVVVDGLGRRVSVPSYTGWWLRRHEVVPTADGQLRRPGEVVRADAPEYLRALYPVVAELPPPVSDLLRQLGVVGSVDEMGPAELGGLLRQLGERGPDVGRELVRRMYAAAGELLYRLGLRPDPPVAMVTAEVAGELCVVDRATAVVVDTPDLAALLGDAPVVPCALADAPVLHQVLGVRLASELGAYAVSSKPAEWLRWRDLDVLDGLVRRLRLDASLDEVTDALGTAYAVHDGLRVLDSRGKPAAVTWRVHDGTVHVDGAAGVWALSRAIAYQLGLWTRRDAIAVYLGADDAERRHLLVEALFDRPSVLFDEDTLDLD